MTSCSFQRRRNPSRLSTRDLFPQQYQFVTLRCCRGIWWRQSWFSLNGTMGIQGKKGALSYATQLLNTNQPIRAPRWLMAYLGLVPSERSTGEQVWRGSITKAGNPRARRVLIEGAWTYRYPARLSRPLQVRQESLPTVVRAIAWKAQLRLCARYRRLMAAGKRQTVVTTAIAREMAAFL